VRETFLNNKSVLNVLNNSDNDDELKCLVAVINSRPFSIFYKARGVKGARTVFPRLVINNLRELPYPKTIEQKDMKSQALAPSKGPIGSADAGEREQC
jgi:hypothetical protein